MLFIVHSSHYGKIFREQSPTSESPFFGPISMTNWIGNCQSQKQTSWHNKQSLLPFQLAKHPLKYSTMARNWKWAMDIISFPAVFYDSTEESLTRWLAELNSPAQAGPSRRAIPPRARTIPNAMVSCFRPSKSTRITVSNAVVKPAKTRMTLGWCSVMELSTRSYKLEARHDWIAWNDLIDSISW